MSKIKKRTPVKAPPEMERAVQGIYDDINAIINAVNSFALSGQEYIGKPGDTRTIAKQQTDGTTKYFFQFKTQDGWIEAEGVKVEDA